ncbi:hypothetical protein [Streptomyces sp. NBC_01618]|uniref:hypothetical protein n=1 Tax=Streptomyces sp. NBC_01618 TaxID=2975900 RepID=UPI00386E6E26|nr:hypothetical protein OH735_35790 [Streptomyces sp. NBC_01618]
MQAVADGATREEGTAATTTAIRARGPSGAAELGNLTLMRYAFRKSGLPAGCAAAAGTSRGEAEAALE